MSTIDADEDRLQFLRELDGREDAYLLGGELDVMYQTRFWEHWEQGHPLSPELRAFVDRMMVKYRHPLESARQALLEHARCRDYEALARAAYEYGSSFSKWKTLERQASFPWLGSHTDGP